jgi:hypothetical protein
LGGAQGWTAGFDGCQQRLPGIDVLHGVATLILCRMRQQQQHAAAAIFINNDSHRVRHLPPERPTRAIERLSRVPNREPSEHLIELPHRAIPEAHLSSKRYQPPERTLRYQQSANQSAPSGSIKRHQS